MNKIRKHQHKEKHSYIHLYTIVVRLTVVKRNESNCKNIYVHIIHQVIDCESYRINIYVYRRIRNGRKEKKEKKDKLSEY